jgi:hypothetical protein
MHYAFCRTCIDLTGKNILSDIFVPYFLFERNNFFLKLRCDWFLKESMYSDNTKFTRQYLMLAFLSYR